MLGTVAFLCVCGVVVANLHLNDNALRGLIARLKQRTRRNVEDIHEDASLKVPQLVWKYGYPLEEHHVTTQDGYILGMHRIPHGRNYHRNPQAVRPVVFLMHGLLSSSADWILMGPNNGLAYILAEEGFDVWLGNARGNHYSRHHIALDPDAKINAAFWKFSWDEIGNIDLPTMIDYALNVSRKDKLHYIGHSQGTTAFFVMCSLRAEYNQKIISMTALAPVAYLTHSISPLTKAVAGLSSSMDVYKMFEIFGQGEVLPNSDVMKWAGEKLCTKEQPTMQEICSNILFLIGGWNAAEMNRTMLPVILSHTPAGASIRQFSHYGQVAHSKEFRRFDHGLLFGNRKAYGTLHPPLYDLSKVKVPVFFHYSKADPLAHEEDVKRLWSEINENKPSTRNEKFIVPMSSFSHLDFLWGIDAKTLVYDRVIKDMKKMQELAVYG